MPFTFPSGFPPVEPIQSVTKPVPRGARFAKGPESTRVIGLNQFLPTHTVLWSPLPTNKLNVLTQFLEARMRGNEWFWWTHPKKGTVKVRCDRYSTESTGNNRYELSAVFAQVVDP